MAHVTCPRESSPPISGMATSCSGSGGVATTVSSMDACHLHHDQELRVAMWEVTTDAEARHCFDSRRLSDGERLRDALGLNSQAGPQMHLNAPRHGDTTTCHPASATSATTRDRSPCRASCPARVSPRLRIKIGGYADSSGIKFSMIASKARPAGGTRIARVGERRVSIR